MLPWTTKAHCNQHLINDLMSAIDWRTDGCFSIIITGTKTSTLLLQSPGYRNAVSRVLALCSILSGIANGRCLCRRHCFIPSLPTDPLTPECSFLTQCNCYLYNDCILFNSNSTSKDKNNQGPSQQTEEHNRQRYCGIESKGGIIEWENNEVQLKPVRISKAGQITTRYQMYIKDGRLPSKCLT